jgi:hypothetical protein
MAIYRTGVEFVELSDHVQSAIEHFVAALKVSRRAAPAIIDGQIADES